jgi:hypothetical protein
MTFGKASALTIALVGAIGLGIWIGPHVMKGAAPAPAASVVQGNGVPTEKSAASKPAAAARAEKPAMKLVVVPASAIQVQDHVKPLLNRGANVALASEGFSNAEQFVTLAHAAKNTEIPFVLLKHRVLAERKSLTVAIRESKPDLDATLEANRARAEAKADMAKLRG